MKTGSKPRDGRTNGNERAFGKEDPDVSLPTKRILSLDDCSEILRLMRVCWENADYESWTTDDEAAAITLLCFSERIDLFTQDLERPGGIGGCQLLRLMKSHAKLSKIPVLIISGYPLDMANQMMKRKGLDLDQTVAGYLAKPFTLDQLYASTAAILGGRKSFDIGVL